MTFQDGLRGGLYGIVVFFFSMSAACSRFAPCVKTNSQQDTVIVVEAGAEPRARLVYTPARLFNSYVFRVIKRTTSFDPKAPPDKNETIIELTPREDYCFDATLEKQESYNDSRRSYGTFSRSAKGRSVVIKSSFFHDDKMDYVLAQILKTTLEELPVVLPNDPVGYGAHWTYSRPYVRRGFRFEQRIDYTLESRDG